MSDNDRPELRAYHELEMLVRHLGDELATFRRRALHAESQLRDGAGARPVSRPSGVGGAPTELESENAMLRTRLERAEERVRQMLDRVRFLRQQLQSQAVATRS